MWILKAAAFVASSLFFLILAGCVRIVASVQHGDFLMRVNGRITKAWGKTMLFILGISVTKVPADEQVDSVPALCVSNHQSYLDIIITASLRPMTFVAKKELEGWALLGWMARFGGTIFVDRRSLRGGVAATCRISTRLQQNLSVHMFPEATSTNGTHILPFKPMLFASALQARSAVLPMTIRYRTIDGEAVSLANCDIVCWHGSMEFLPHFFRLIRTRSITAEVIHHPLIYPSLGDTARTLAEESFAAVASASLFTVSPYTLM